MPEAGVGRVASARTLMVEDGIAMSGERGPTGEVGAKLNFLLENLRKLESGPARIANLLVGLKANHVRADHVRELVQALPRPPSDTWEVYAELLDHIRKLNHALYFQRPSPPAWDRPIALVAERSLFDQGVLAGNIDTRTDHSVTKPFRLFSEKYITMSKSRRMVQDQITHAGELADLLEYIREGLQTGLADDGLGKPGRVVFITPVDAFWENLTAERFCRDGDPLPSPGSADRVCDFLGLPYRNSWLVELRSRLKLGELVEQGRLTLAAPTVIEAWAHDYFRHWPREEAADRWGRTLHVGGGFVGRANPEGLPEAIVDHLSPKLLSEAFEVSILGRVTARQIPLQKDINIFLVKNGELAALVREIVARVMQ
jgi:hypothetical protein